MKHNLREAVIFDDLDEDCENDKEELDDCMDSSGISEFAPEHVGVKLQKQTESRRVRENRSRPSKIDLSKYKKVQESITEADDLDEDYLTNDVVSFDDVLDNKYKRQSDNNDRFLKQFLDGIYNEPADATVVAIDCLGDDCDDDYDADFQDEATDKYFVADDGDDGANDFENKLCKDIREATKPIKRTSLFRQPKMEKVRSVVRRTSLLKRSR